MSTILTIVGSASLVFAALVTLVNLASMKCFTMRAPSGADAMGLVVVLIALILMWALVLVGMAAGAWRGAYAWMGLSGLGTGAVVTAACVGLGLVCGGATFESMNTSRAGRTLIGMSGGFVLPMVAIAFAAAMLWGPLEATPRARWAWWFGIPLALVAAAGWTGAGVVWAKSEQARARAAAAAREGHQQEEEARAAEQVERDAVHAAELAALPDETPLSVFARHLFIDRSEAHHALALERIRALPRLDERLAEALRGPDPLEREYILNIVRSYDEPDPAWAPAVAGAITRLADDLRRLGAGDGHGHGGGMCVGAMLTAEKFTTARFDAETGALRAAMESWPGEDSREKALAAIDQYLRREPVEWR